MSIGWVPTRIGRPQRGFTLMELLIAMTLVSLIALSLFSALRTGIRAWDTGTERAQVTADTQLIQSFLARTLRQTRRLFVNDPDAGRVLAFEGSEDTLVAVAPLLMYLDVGGLYRITLFRDDGERGAMVMSYSPFRPGASEPTEPETVVLLEGIEELSFRYFGAAEPGQGPKWYDEWDNVQAMPRLVQVTVVSERGKWPELTIPLPAQ